MEAQPLKVTAVFNARKKARVDYYGDVDLIGRVIEAVANDVLKRDLLLHSINQSNFLNHTCMVDKQFLTEEGQVLAEVGFLSNDGDTLSHKGVNALFDILFEDKKEQLIAKAKEIIAARKTE